MSLQLRKYLAAFFLLLFLFLTVTEIAHPYIHKDDVRCTEIGIHVHKTEHHCAFCDFVPLIATTPPTAQFSISVPETTSWYLTFYKAPHVLNNHKYSFSLRDPPFVS